MPSHKHNPHLHQHPTHNGQSIRHKIVHACHQHHGKPHPHTHRTITVDLGHGHNGGVMAMVNSFKQNNARKRHEWNETCAVIVRGIGTFYVTFSEAMIRMINALGSIPLPSMGVGGSAHVSSSTRSSLPWWDRKWQEYCDETFRQAEREHHH